MPQDPQAAQAPERCDIAIVARLGPALVAALLTGVLACLLATPLTATARSEPAWTTYHRDPARSGDDPDAVEPIAPKEAWQTVDLGAPIWGQPLVLGSRVYVATVGDDIYALEAATGKVVWKKSVGTPVPYKELPCGDIKPTVGIVGTPVIDAAAKVIYTVADTWYPSTKQAEHVLEGLGLKNGEEVLSTPVDPPGSDPKALLQRTSLNLDQGRVVFGFGGNDGDCSDYRGAVAAVPEGGGRPLFWQVPIALPSTSGGAIWAPTGPVVDSVGKIYATTGNPNPAEELKPGATYDYSDSVVKLDPAVDFVADPATEAASPLGWFEPPTWLQDSNTDTDLGSAGPELLPGGVLFQAGKNGTGYLIDEATMSSGAPAAYEAQVCNGAGSFGGDSYASGVIYMACTNGVQALSYDEAARTFTPLWQGPSNAFGPPIVSAGLVWVIATGGFSGGGKTLYGLDPATGVPRYTETLPSPIADHFASPSAAGGRLFVSTGSSVTAYQIAALSTVTGESGSSSPAPGASAPAGAATSNASPPGGAATSNGGPPGGTSTSNAGPPPAGSTLRLLRNQLRATAGGRVRLALECLSLASRCKGTVTLIAEISVTTRSGRHRVRRVIPIKLARASFGHAKGDFTIIVQLSRNAETHLRLHHDRLTLQVMVSSGGIEDQTRATLTQSAQPSSDAQRAR
jgi:polyvinyl alcohol dehydrogenase (cytochrome)